MRLKRGHRKTGAVRDPPAIYGAAGTGVVFYRSPDGSVKLDVKLEKDTVWLSLNQIGELFGRDKSVISRHLRNVFASRELDREATVAKFATVQDEGGREVVREIEHFNLDAILSVGYRVNSRRGTQFRIWATQVLRDHLLKGYSVNRCLLSDHTELFKQFSENPEFQKWLADTVFTATCEPRKSV